MNSQMEEQCKEQVKIIESQLKELQIKYIDLLSKYKTLDNIINQKCRQTSGLADF
jgi:hypothetical protein